LAPPIMYSYGWHAPFYVEHYGLMTKADRLKKAERYKKYDPNARFKSSVYYDDLIKDLREIPFNREKLLRQLKESVDCKPRKRPNINIMEQEQKKFVYLRRIKDGALVDIPLSAVEETMARGGFEKIGVVERAEEKRFVHEPPVVDNELECGICGFKAKNKAGLTAHKRKHI